MNRCSTMVRICCCGFALSLFGSSLVQADTALDDYNVAVKLYKAARWPLASKQFQEFLAKYPQHEKAPLSAFYLGLTYINQENYQAARDVLRSFTKKYPDNANVPQARYRIAECSFLLDDLKSARGELQEFLDKHPNDPLGERAWPYLGEVQLRLGEADRALATFDRALQTFPKSALVSDAKFGRGRALETLKRYGDALQQYQELAADKANPRAAEAQFQIGSLEFAAQHFAASAEAYRTMLREFPASSLAVAARLNAGYALFQAGDFAQAADQFAASQKDAANAVAAGYWRGLSLKSQGNFAQAAEVFASIAAEADDGPYAESLQFQRAICARQMNEPAQARELFLKGSERWPKGEFADDSVHAAAELAVDAGDLEQATKLLERFARDYAGSGLRLHYELLLGRVELAKGSAQEKERPAGANTPPDPAQNEHFQQAIKRFEHVLQESMVERTRLLARYYLALTRQFQALPEDALKTIAPVIEAVDRDGAKSDLGEALIVQSESELALKRFAPAREAAMRYLELFPGGRQVARALAAAAVSAAQSGDWPAAKAAIDQLAEQHRANPVTPGVLFQIAELAEQQNDWPTSAKLYQTLIDVSGGTDNQAFAIRGLAWSQFKQNEFGPAAEQFGRVVRQFPQHKLVSECAYYQAESLREAGQLEPAAAAFVEVFQKYAPTAPAEPGAEQLAPMIYSYRAGRQRARTLQALQQIDQADQAYEALTQKFPHPKGLDSLLDEWAFLNYDAGRFERADVLFRRLIQEVPGSELADNARFSLAESDLVAGRNEEARRAFEALLASDQSDAEVKERSLYRLIVLAVDEQRWAEVPKLRDRMVREFPNSSYVSYADYGDAEAKLSSAKTTDEELVVVRNSLNQIIQSARAELPADAWQGRAWVLLAETYFREKNYDAVKKTADDFHQAQPNSIYGYQAEEIVGRSYKQQADFPEAIKTFERVLADPNAFRTETAAKCQFLIAESYFLDQKYEDAFLAYQKVYASYDFSYWQAAALLQSGKCDEQLAQWKEAAASYARVLEEFPQSEFVPEAKQRLEIARKKAGG
ncbi:MAG: tetratricopeptide repeat protein [Planctomycetaceae bacterium]